MAEERIKMGSAGETDTMEQMNGNEMDLKAMETIRVSKQAEKALEEKLHKLMNSRRGVLGHITRKMKLKN